jgi:tRNA A-37 threonylcarbamoyl transferase component Bud32
VTDGTELIAGRYRLISRVGSGAMGVVWQARDERLGRTVAVKQLRSPIGMSSTQIEQAQQRARREARIAARLQHPHAVAVFDVAEHDGRPCLVMEYVPSRSLSEVLADGGALPAAQVAQIGAHMASALVAAHEAGIVHRDIKPGNILMTESGAVKLTDFGISRATGDVTLTGTGEMLGTPAFTSPEVAQGRTAGASSDVFSLGATLYAALEGTPPFGMGPNAMALLLRIVNDEIRPPEHVGPLMSTLLWMLRHEPMDRPSMDVVRRELESATEETVSVLAVAVESGPAAQEGDAERGSGGAGAALGDVAAAGEEAGEASVTDAVPAPPGVASQSPKSGFRRPPRALLLPASLLLAAAVVTAGIVAAITASNGGSGTPSGTATRTAAATHTSPATTAPAAAPTSAHASSPTKASASATSGSPTADVAQQLTTAITDYYRLVPGNLSTAWNYLTPDYQQNTAKGMSGYTSFWGQIQSVTVSGVSADPPSTVVATLVYHYKNGNVVTERTSFQLVRQGGTWKIAHSSVLSSGSQ